MRDIIMYTAKDIQEIFGMSKTRAYAMMALETFPSIKIGGRYYIEQTALKSWLQENQYRTVLV